MAPVTQERRTVEVDGAERWYLLTVPSDPASPAPLVLDFHGLSEGAELHARTSGYDVVAEREGFVVAYPHGSGSLASWTVDPTGANADARFVDVLVARLGDDLCLDTSRVYATGLSNGALLSSSLGCSRASTFAAIAPVAGAAFPEQCDPAGAVPMITFHGTADPILLFNGGVGQVLPELLSGKPITPTTLPPADLDGAGYPAAAAAWAEANGCGEPADEQVSDAIVHRVWDCPDGADTEMWIVLGGGHTWPGSDALTGPISQIVGSTTEEIDATELSWEFFGRQRRD
jgi:polyhydroxybutyrate depolymerase